MGQYLPVVVMAVLAVLFAVGGLATSRLLAPRNPTRAKLAPYESGIVPAKGTPERFPVRFFLIAMSFIVFDIEIIFMYPWAVIYRNLGPFGIGAIVLFGLPVIVSLAYEISKGALDWGPVKRTMPAGAAGMVSEMRTTSSTVRRVGLEGRFDASGGDPGEAA
ncbi:MAG: NADH-quinone oxidoreductase subunit A [Acidimicrobiia bacterium]